MSEEQEVMGPAVPQEPPPPGTPRLNAALARCNAKISNPSRDKEVMIRSEKGTYRFRYATMASILDIVRPAMSAEGLSVGYTISEDNRWFIATLYHESGEERSIRLPWNVPTSVEIKTVGSSLTYRERYAMAMFFPFAADDDDDGSAETGDAVEASRPIGAAAREQERRPWKRPEPAPAPVTADTRNAELAKLMAVVKAYHFNIAIPTEGGKPRTGTIIPPDMIKAVEVTNIEYHRTPEGQNYVLPGDLEPRQVAVLRGLYEQHIQAADAGAALGNAPAPATSKP
jgi:hypothetical protein